MILKNINNTAKQWGGISIPAGDQYVVQEADKHRLLSDLIFLADLDNNLAVINDSILDVDRNTALLLLRDKEFVYKDVYDSSEYDLAFSGTLEIT